MSRKSNDGEPVFKGIGEDGEPIFVWPPEIQAWLRAEYARAWKLSQPRARARPRTDKP